MSETMFERENPYAATVPWTNGASADGFAWRQVDWLGARAQYEIDGRRLDVYWSHWTGLEAYAVDGRVVATVRSGALRRRQCIELAPLEGSCLEIETCATPEFRVRIWREGKLLLEEGVRGKQTLERGIVLLLAVGLLALGALFTAYFV